MAVFTTSADNAIRFTVVKVKGELVPGELYEYLTGSDFKNRTDLLLWDYREGSWSHLPTEYLMRGFKFSAEHSNDRQKTAYVFSSEADYGVGRMFQTHAENLNHKAEIKLFMDYKQAEDWLLAIRQNSRSLCSTHD